MLRARSVRAVPTEHHKPAVAELSQSVECLVRPAVGRRRGRRHARQPEATNQTDHTLFLPSLSFLSLLLVAFHD
eukprot:scaffold7956_cov32-Tisochrysis_lutea.AAC.7